MLTDPDMKVKPRGKIYSINEGYTNNWAEPIKQYVASKKEVRMYRKSCTVQLVFIQKFKLVKIRDIVSIIFNIDLIWNSSLPLFFNKYCT